MKGQRQPGRIVITSRTGCCLLFFFPPETFRVRSQRSRMCALSSSRLPLHRRYETPTATLFACLRELCLVFPTRFYADRVENMRNGDTRLSENKYVRSQFTTLRYYSLFAKRSADTSFFKNENSQNFQHLNRRHKYFTQICKRKLHERRPSACAQKHSR